MATEAPVSGGVVSLLGINAQQLSSEEIPCRQLTIRNHPGNDEISIGHAGVTIGTRWAFILESEPFTIGPFNNGSGVRPCDIYVVGTPGDLFTWAGYHW